MKSNAGTQWLNVGASAVRQKTCSSPLRGDFKRKSCAGTHWLNVGV